MTSTARPTLVEARPPAVRWRDAPDPHLVAQLSDVTPGRALDVGCGDGADVRWLARHGWQVEGLDESPETLERAARRVRETAPELEPAITWRRSDVVDDPPESEGYDLVACQVGDVPAGRLSRVVAGLASAVRRTGTLLVVGHAQPGAAAASSAPGPSADDVAALLDDSWLVDVCGTRPRTVALDGEPVTVHDTVVRATRL